MVIRLPNETATEDDVCHVAGLDKDGNIQDRFFLGQDVEWIESHWETFIGGPLLSVVSLRALKDTQARLDEFPLLQSDMGPLSDQTFLMGNKLTQQFIKVQASSLPFALAFFKEQTHGAADHFARVDHIPSLIDQMSTILLSPQWEGVEEDVRYSRNPLLEQQRLQQYYNLDQ